MSVSESLLLASGARTTSQTLDPLAISTAAQVAYGFTGTPRVLEVTVDTTAFGSGSVTPSIEVYDEGKGGFVSVLAGAAIVAVGTVVLRYGLGITPVTNLAAQGVVGKRWRVVCTANNANTQTYSVGARILTD